MIIRIVSVLACMAMWPALANAQQTVAAEAPAKSAATAGEQLLARPVTVRLDHVPLEQAINALSVSAGIKIQYVVSVVNAYRQSVTLHVTRTALGAALDRILRGTQLEVVVLPGPLVAVVENGIGQRPGESAGSVSGHVTDARTRRPLRGVSVTIDDSGSMVHTDETGAYHFGAVPPGAHRVSTRLIGFARQTKLVTVTANETVVVDFALESSTVNTLDQVVVTATGAQRYRELGHVVSQINADSLVREAPVTNLSELLTSRVPGLQVMSSSGGIAGGEVALRIRGQSTMALDPQPVVIVDGVRYKNTNFDGQGEDGRPFNALQRSPLNDLSVNDIETVEVVKGPSASTLYGPDAAGGVIIVTTKRGRPGKPEWHVYAYPDLNTLQFGSNNALNTVRSLRGWGHVPNTTTLYTDQCDLFAQAARFCVLDSVTATPIPANNPQQSVIAKQRPQWHSGGSVSGGGTGLVYFFSGNFDSETGVIRPSAQAQDILKRQLGVKTLSDAVRNPNTQQALNLHANVSSQINAMTNVSLAANYTQATQRAIDIGAFLNQYTASAPRPGADSAANLNQQLQVNSFLSTTSMDVHRLTTTLSGVIQPRTWLNVNASLGIDLDNTTDQAVRPRDAVGTGDGGEAADNRRGNTNRNAHLGSIATGHAGPFSFRTSFGVDYSYINLDGISTDGRNLAPGSYDITTASSQSVRRLWNETASLGGYGEEVWGVSDRFFVTTSLRLDGSTSFGDAYTPRPFPKIGASWVISDEPMFRPFRDHGFNDLRLRYSFGAASRYPTSAMRLGLITPTNVVIEDRTNSIFQQQQLANPLLQPEHSRETEYGFDAGIGAFAHMEVAWYTRRTNDVLQQLGAPLGFLGGWANVGNLSARGFEVTTNIRAYESSRTSLGLIVTYARNTNKVLSLGALSERKSINGSVVIGYPLNAVFGTKAVGYADTATLGGFLQPNDGFISLPSEVISSPVQYLGVLDAPSTYTVTPTLSLFGSRIRISTLVDRQTGGVQLNPISFFCVSMRTCTGAFIKNPSLLQQAIRAGFNQGDEVVSSDFTRWREFNITGDLPLSARQYLHLSRASMSVQVRNLALWTKSSAPDVESVPGNGLTATPSLYGAWGVPQPRVWAVRFDVTP